MIIKAKKKIIIIKRGDHSLNSIEIILYFFKFFTRPRETLTTCTGLKKMQKKYSNTLTYSCICICLYLNTILNTFRKKYSITYSEWFLFTVRETKFSEPGI